MCVFDYVKDDMWLLTHADATWHFGSFELADDVLVHTSMPWHASIRDDMHMLFSSRRVAPSDLKAKCCPATLV